MIRTNEGIVLHHLKYGDQSIIVHILHRERGVRSYMVHSPRSKKGNLRRSFFQPLQILTYVGQEKNDEQLGRIREVSELIPLHSIGSDVVKSSLAMFMGEVLYKTLKEDEGSTALFDELKIKVLQLESDQTLLSDLPIWTMYTLSRHLGILPSSEEEGSVFDLREGVFRGHCDHPDQLSTDAAELWRKALQELDSKSPLSLNPEERGINLDSWIYYFRVQRSGLGEFRSLSVLRELFH
jgi:DNA repair protein RecO (recombination protein O)